MPTIELIRQRSQHKGATEILSKMHLSHPRELNIRMAERIDERRRIARDLHDGVLQSFQGVLMKFHLAMDQLPDRPQDARVTIERAIQQARQALMEGRNAIEGLRSLGGEFHDLAKAIESFCAGLSSEFTNPPTVQIRELATLRDLAPLVCDEVFQLVKESLRNVFRHAEAEHIEVEIHYGPRYFRVRLYDDGKGFDARTVQQRSRTRHHGLTGMHILRGKLAICSRPGVGTEIELTVPASLAYVKSQNAGRNGELGNGG